MGTFLIVRHYTSPLITLIFILCQGIGVVLLILVDRSEIEKERDNKSNNTFI